LTTQEYEFKQPLLLLNTQGFDSNPYILQGENDLDSLPTSKGKGKQVRVSNSHAHKKLFADAVENKTKKNYDIELENTLHLDQSDFSLCVPAITRSIGLTSKQPVKEKYQLNINIVLAFLNEHEFLPAHFAKSVDEVMKE